MKVRGNENSSQYKRWLYDDLKEGTTQNTKHIPGYQGFMPNRNTSLQGHEQGLGMDKRTTWMKQNIIQYYHTKIPGYAGH